MLRKVYNKILRLISGHKYITGTLSSTKQSNLTIGNNVSFGGNVLLYGNATINIGDNTMIAYGVIIHTSTHDYNSHPMWQKRIDQPVKIGHDVWIGTGAIILPGVIIEDYAVVGAGSVVTSNVPKGAIVVGNPARIIKYRDENAYLNKTMSITNPKDASIILSTYKTDFCKKNL